LTIARDLVAAHGGTIAAASQPGHGTTITIRLPILA
jgi:signal transduction histidine kinase